MAEPKPAPPAPGGEDAAIERIWKVLGPPPPGQLWFGDDAAVVMAEGALLLTCDAVVEGVHVDLELCSLEDMGWKALTVAVSDIAAMGGKASHALCTMTVPAGTDVETVASGMTAASSEWGCPIVGGDLTGGEQIVLSVAVTGTVEGSVPAVTRTGASPGDELFVTGALGGSAAGLRLLRDGLRQGPLVEAHRRPRARLAEGSTARLAGATAMMDISDGLAIDVHRLARASSVGVRLSDVPVVPGATKQEALGGGEDYELVIATGDPRRLVDAFAEADLRRPIHIGTLTGNSSERTLNGEPLELLGWQHDISLPR